MQNNSILTLQDIWRDTPLGKLKKQIDDDLVPPDVGISGERFRGGLRVRTV